MTRVLIENSSYHLRNAGDAAMLAVANRRLAEAWPDAQRIILTEEPDRVPLFCPGALPETAFVASRRAWMRDRIGYGRWPGRLGKRLGGKLRGRERQQRLSNAGFCDSLFPSSLEAYGPKPPAWLKTVEQADLVICTGGGYLTDAHQPHAEEALCLIHAAKLMDKPVALTGQGIGPVDRSASLNRACEHLRHVDHIGLREGVTGEPLMQRWGVDPARYVVTGDDAIELSLTCRDEPPGRRVGVNVRRAAYAGVNGDSNELSQVIDAVSRFGKEQDANLRPIPISFNPNESDAEALSDLLGVCASEMPKVEELGALIRWIAGCRVIVTGSYHAGLFGLALGRPVIGLIASAYYQQKFDGLTRQFPGGCMGFDLSLPDPGKRMGDALQAMWNKQPDVCGSLLEAADRQIALSRDLYQRIGTLLTPAPEEAARAGEVAHA